MESCSKLLASLRILISGKKFRKKFDRGIWVKRDVGFFLMCGVIRLIPLWMLEKNWERI